ncbi:hypothetical protein [Polyangium sp. 6x1]|uniref:hypothetical protein n=1 Tax=Polyangium sp. 6x1 TaxID=3042689 RepID=UPI002482E6FA|nr:hypothetical protein [Polyangium sp. 6x1]MDI1446604.1 hypothetical protein [Polyangium sp. 6x1]
MKKSLRVLSAAFASAMLLAASGQAVAGDWGGGLGYGNGYYGPRGGVGYRAGYGYGGLGRIGGYYGGWGGGYAGYGGFPGYGYGGYGGYGYGGYGGVGVGGLGGFGGWGAGGACLGDLAFDDIDVCFDGEQILCRFPGASACGVDQVEIYAFLTGGATCGAVGGGGWYGGDGFFSDVGIGGYYATPLAGGNIWQGAIGLDDYYDDFCPGGGAFGGDLDFARMRLYIAGREFAFNDIGPCGGGWD